MNKTIANPLPVSAVRVTDPFFAPRINVVRGQMLPYQWDALNDRLPGAEPSHSVENFRIAAGLSRGAHHGMVFQDSDLYKWLEAVAYVLAIEPDNALRAHADEAIGIMERAQRQDGYLNTYYQLNGIDRRWTNLQDNHELYCAGHLFEAAVAYYLATQTDKLLRIAVRYADLIDSVFGVDEGKMRGYPGHEVIEMGLVQLYRVTGEARYLKLAKYFIDQRGQSPLYFEEEAKKDNNRKFYWDKTYMRYQYYQAGKPVREQTVAEGHAVRAMYLYAGMADVAMETGDDELLSVCEALFTDIADRQMYITGAIGATEVGESFTYGYDLPNDTVYAETCAQIGLCFFAQRMLRHSADRRYADVLERALYNGVLSGMSLDGTRFFYVNPLEVTPIACEQDDLRRHVKPERQQWYTCSCCPPNLARIVCSAASYAYAAKGDTLYVHLYLGGELKARLDGLDVEMKIESGYPWKGEVRVRAMTAGRYALALRVPGWCRGWSVSINGERADAELDKGYIYLRCDWAAGDEVLLSLEMPVTLVRANPAIREDIGKLAVTRGPLVYCLEEADNGADLHQIALSHDTQFEVRHQPDLLNGVYTLHCSGVRLQSPGFENNALYAPADQALSTTPVPLTWIPYYAWANRGIGEMTVWVKEL